MSNNKVDSNTHVECKSNVKYVRSHGTISENFLAVVSKKKVITVVIQSITCHKILEGTIMFLCALNLVFAICWCKTVMFYFLSKSSMLVSYVCPNELIWIYKTLNKMISISNIELSSALAQYKTIASLNIISLMSLFLTLYYLQLSRKASFNELHWLLYVIIYVQILPWRLHVCFLEPTNKKYKLSLQQSWNYILLFSMKILQINTKYQC